MFYFFLAGYLTRVQSLPVLKFAEVMAAKATKKKVKQQQVKKEQAKPKEAKQQQNVPVWRYMNKKNYGKHYLYHETRESRARKEAEKKEKEKEVQQKNVQPQQPKVPSSKEEEVLQPEKKKEENEVDKKKSQNQKVDIPQQTSTSSPKKVEIVEAKQTNEAKKEEPKVAVKTPKAHQSAAPKPKMKPPPEMDKMPQSGAAVFIPDSFAVVIGSDAEGGGEEGSVKFVEIEPNSKEEKTTFAVVSENSAAVTGELGGLLQQVKKEMEKEEEEEKVKSRQKQVGEWLLEKMRMMEKGREHREKQPQQTTTTSTSSLLDKVADLLKEYQLEEVAEALQKSKERLKPHLEKTAQNLATSAELVKRKVCLLLGTVLDDIKKSSLS